MKPEIIYNNLFDGKRLVSAALDHEMDSTLGKYKNSWK